MQIKNHKQIQKKIPKQTRHLKMKANNKSEIGMNQNL